MLTSLSDVGNEGAVSDAVVRWDGNSLDVGVFRLIVGVHLGDI